ncbi:MAG: hypothetical protein ACM3ZA_09325 [Bacillota bacterium]
MAHSQWLAQVLRAATLVALIAAVPVMFVASVLAGLGIMANALVFQPGRSVGEPAGAVGGNYPRW